MSSDPEEFSQVDFGGLVLDAAREEDFETAEKILRSSMLYVLNQIDEDADVEFDDEEGGEFNLVIAESDDEVALICFTSPDHVENFLDSISEELPEDYEIPVIAMSGSMLLDGLPEDFGLLVNPNTDLECFFPAGIWQEASVEDGSEEE
ncbi:MAG: hypothetical protein KatS3mg111_0096 [Pirellulaceae bacterium]|nr:MAG: hypothetical protein KatS3mg111_0096 [Pirellulaceae bacterium]